MAPSSSADCEPWAFGTNRLRRPHPGRMAPESFVHTRSSAGFTITTSGFEFSVHTHACGALLGFKPKPKQPAFAARVFRCLPKSRALPRQQIRDPHLEKGGICRIGVRIARAMTPHARDRPQGPGWKIGKLGRIIGNAEIQIRLARHQEHLRSYGLQRLREIAVV